MWHTMADHVTCHSWSSRDIPWLIITWHTMADHHVAYHSWSSCYIPWLIITLHTMTDHDVTYHDWSWCSGSCDGAHPAFWANDRIWSKRKYQDCSLGYLKVCRTEIMYWQLKVGVSKTVPSLNFVRHILEQIKCAYHKTHKHTHARTHCT